MAIPQSTSMSFLILSFLTSLVVTRPVVRSAEQHLHHSAGHDLSGSQEFYSTPVPRVGGVGVDSLIFDAALIGTGAYPIFETLFTMYRRKVVRGVSTGAPDYKNASRSFHRA